MTDHTRQRMNKSMKALRELRKLQRLCRECARPLKKDDIARCKDCKLLHTTREKELFWIKVPGVAGTFNAVSIFETREDAELASKALYQENLHIAEIKVAVTMDRHVAAQLFADMPQEVQR